MTHCQSCCESVTLSLSDGDLNNLVDSEILEVESCTVDNKPSSDEVDCYTTIRMSTAKGEVMFSSYGSSNGYYGIDISVYATRLYSGKVPQ